MTALTRPILKWAGSKYSSVLRIRAELPSGDRLVEPFVGGGSVFLNTNYSRYLLNDKNPYLISFYRNLRDGSDTFIEECRSFFKLSNNESEVYYELRQEFNDARDPYIKSVLFLYLNRHCYNGLCRFNRSGEFNVPFGRYAVPYFPEKEMRSFLARTRRADFENVSYAEVLDHSEIGDVIYCDPPYVPLSETAKFTDYVVGGFSLDDHWDLARRAQALGEKGIRVVVSNHDTPLTREMYGSATIISFAASRRIGRDTESRKPVQELLAVF